ncbi:hypothetical protein EEK96_16680 [Escherichia coli]|nr:hypothetical protein [Escherichia coli]
MEANDEEYSARTEPPVTLTPALSLKGRERRLSRVAAVVKTWRRMVKNIRQGLNRRSPSPSPLLGRAREPTEPGGCCGENMEANDEEYSARTESPVTLALSLKGAVCACLLLG